MTVAHPWGNGHPTLTQWIANGPGPRRLVGVVAAERKSTGEKVDLAEIPLEYHTSPESRRLQRLGQLPAPWGPPLDDEPAPMEIPDHIRRLVD